MTTRPIIRRPLAITIPAGSNAAHITYHMRGYFYERSPAVWDTWTSIDSINLVPPGGENVRGATVVGVS